MRPKYTSEEVCSLEMRTSVEEHGERRRQAADEQKA